MLWREIQKNNFTDLNALLKFLEIEDDKKNLFLLRPFFVLNLPIRLAQKIKKNCLSDPLLKQFLPLIDEEKLTGFIDPVEDHSFQKTPSLLQKYPGRALIITTAACAMHCRYCFRKNYDYKVSDFKEEIDVIKHDISIEEVLLSGGDPLSLSDAKLFALLDELDHITHVKRIRFHTRFIIGIPERIHEGFLKKLKSLNKQIIFVIHVNHASELDDDILHVCKLIQKCGIPVLSQTVLLKDINDSLDILINLFKALIDTGIIPYYLHQFDPVQGSMHFEVEKEKGLHLHLKLREHLPGYAIPDYVQEVPGALSKTELTSIPAFQ